MVRHCVNGSGMVWYSIVRGCGECRRRLELANSEVVVDKRGIGSGEVVEGEIGRRDDKNCGYRLSVGNASVYGGNQVGMETPSAARMEGIGLYSSRCGRGTTLTLQK